MRNQLRRREVPVACPFCESRVPRPTKLPEADQFVGGRCQCGALYVFDETGREGGQILVEGLAILCDGDLDRAMGLSAGRDYEVKDLGYRARSHSVEPKALGHGGFGRPKLYFFRRLI